MDRCSKQSRTVGGIPLRPELVEFLDAQALCRYTACSKAIRRDERELNAWKLLADVQAPRSAQDAALAAERESIARVRPQVRRRLVADVVPAGDATRTFRTNEYADFTLFVRLTEEGVVIWEGDLKSLEGVAGEVYMNLPLATAWSALKKSGNDANIAEFLRQNTEDSSSVQYSQLNNLQLTVVAVRDEDQAEIPPGSFCYADDIGAVPHAMQQRYIFRQFSGSLFSTAESHFDCKIYLSMTHGDAGATPSMDGLEMHLRFNSKVLLGNDEEYLSTRQEKHLITVLGGVHYSLVEEAFGTIRD